MQAAADLFGDATVAAFSRAVRTIDQRDTLDRKLQRRLVCRQAVNQIKRANRSENCNRCCCCIALELCFGQGWQVM